MFDFSGTQWSEPLAMAAAHEAQSLLGTYSYSKEWAHTLLLLQKNINCAVQAVTWDETSHNDHWDLRGRDVLSAWGMVYIDIQGNQNPQTLVIHPCCESREAAFLIFQDSPWNSGIFPVPSWVWERGGWGFCLHVLVGTALKWDFCGQNAWWSRLKRLWGCTAEPVEWKAQWEFSYAWAAVSPALWNLTVGCELCWDIN